VTFLTVLIFLSHPTGQTTALQALRLNGSNDVFPRYRSCLLGILKMAMTSYLGHGESDLTQNDMPMTTKWSKSEPKVEIQYVGRSFSETGIDFYSAFY